MVSFHQKNKMGGKDSLYGATVFRIQEQRNLKLGGGGEPVAGDPLVFDADHAARRPPKKTQITLCVLCASV
jgi:hypothetical protein